MLELVDSRSGTTFSAALLLLLLTLYPPTKQPTVNEISIAAAKVRGRISIAYRVTSGWHNLVNQLTSRLGLAVPGMDVWRGCWTRAGRRGVALVGA